MKKVVTGNHAVSYAAKIARAEVVAAYPITPQTQVVEKISSFCADGEMDAIFIKVESEHSACAATIGASAAGARAFTATSSQGLALMHEMLHWAANARVPIVIANINRAMGPPWTIWTDQNDSLSQRDTGWIQIYCEGNQDVLDSVIQAFKISEQVSIPSMVVLDAFFLSHTSEPVDLPEQKTVDKFLPKYEAKWKLDITDPHTYGGLTGPDRYYELRYNLQKDFIRSVEVIDQVHKEFKEIFGREYGRVEPFMADDAEVLLVVSGTIASTAKQAVLDARQAGFKLGSLKVRFFRPFPQDLVQKYLAGKKSVAVIDRNYSFGSEGIFYSEVKGAMYNQPHIPIYSYIAGLGGRDVAVRDILGIAELAKAGKCDNPTWWGVKP
jgi:pyruvate/2-oxoacid:ferredoxin oxidoreductase alpha subunit